MRLIGCEYNDYEANGGLHDALADGENIIIFDNEHACVDFAEHYGLHLDNLDVWDIDTLRLVGYYYRELARDENGKLKSFAFIKK